MAQISPSKSAFEKYKPGAYFQNFTVSTIVVCRYMDFFPRPTRPEQQMSFEVSDQYFTDRNSPFLASNLLKSVTILIVVEDPVKRAFYHYQVGTLILLLHAFLNTLVVCVACFYFSSVQMSEGMARPRGDSGGGNPHFSSSNPLTRDLVCDLLIISLFFSI